ncbi:hypothetical protein GO755_26080 [Spirosoma sp. HMF4905]|uniref:Uncharacterized protein n=1 Tax=Spirosoma arboris TaxID=2682092 RepID=A0A7K1SID5_9BACT|nr:hypothetical protein [Spirosoma arboris]MVM33533.1 hypothetical protein [Spirosoma arboris]
MQSSSFPLLLLQHLRQHHFIFFAGYVVTDGLFARAIFTLSSLPAVTGSIRPFFFNPFPVKLAV